jgi:hypothetical protein
VVKTIPKWVVYDIVLPTLIIFHGIDGSQNRSFNHPAPFPCLALANCIGALQNTR